MIEEKFDQFEHVCSQADSGIRRRCHCGTTYYDMDSIKNLEEGEHDELVTLGAIAVNGSLSCLEFEGMEYVAICNCWRERAERIIGFIESHAGIIARYLSLEKKRLERVASEFPQID